MSEAGSSRVVALLVALAPAALAGCGGEDPPTDCGDDSMSIITFLGKDSKSENAVRTCVDIHAASRRDATESAPGRDESLATSRANAIPWTAVTFAGAVEACGRAGKFLCDSDQLRAIAPIAGIAGGSGEVLYDETAIEALSPTSDVSAIAHRFDQLNPVDMMISQKTGQPPFPESTGSVAYWTYSPERLDRYNDPDVPLLFGRLQADSAVGGYLQSTPVLDDQYSHPLLGFRCCINARMRGAFEPVKVDDRYLREEEPDVPIQDR
ncbi:MAG TPA: hypothetical protein VHP33_16845 [Polyangiaceae bacterium]|nr:hypothetical protein [Polyangiaceae bacterium]